MNRCLSLLALFLVVSSPAISQQPEAIFEFNVPYDYEISNALVPRISGIADREVTIDDGHFVYADNNERMRVFGVTVYYSAAFPDSVDAISTARRLASLGFNCVRFLGIDYSFWNAATVLQNAADGGSDRLSADRMQRLDWFVYQLKQHGIYSHIPLHSRRQARAQDNVTNWDTIPYQSRIVMYYDEDLRREYKKFASLFLNHVNQYTGKAYKDEPALAFLDVLDDQSLFQMWRVYGLQAGDYDNFSYYHAQKLDTLWHEWLKEKYGSHEALSEAWGGQTEDEIQTLANGDFENPFFANWQLSVNEAARAIAHPTDCEVSHGELGYHVRIGQVASPPVLTHIQLRNQSFKVERGALYRLEFDAKSASGDRQLRVDLYNSIAPYNQYGLYNREVTVTNEWTRQSMEFRATATDEFGGVLRLYFGNSEADLYLDNFEVIKVGETGLEPGEHLDNMSVRRIAFGELSSVPMQRASDMVEFYAYLVEDFYRDVKTFVNDDLQCDKPLGASGVYDRIMDVAVADVLDFTSPYTTWDYPRNSGGDDTWAIGGDAMLASTYCGSLPNITRAKIKGKPAIASRLYMPFPNPHMGELATVWPAYLQYQDFDGMYLWYYATSSADLMGEEIPMRDFYSIRNVSGLLATLPLASHAFRKGTYSVAETFLDLQQRREDVLYPPFQSGTYWLESSADNRMNLFRGVAWESFDAAAQTAYPQNDVYEITGGEGLDLSDMRTDTDEILWNATEQYFTGYTGKYLAVQGVLSGQLLDFNDIIIGQNNSAFPVSIQWYALDDTSSLTQARSALLTVSSRTHIDGSTWEQQGSLWRYDSWEGDHVIEAANLEFIIESSAESVFVFPINNYGIQQQERIEATSFGNRHRFVIDQTEHPYTWFRVVQQFSSTSTEQPEALPAANVDVFPTPATEFATVVGNVAQEYGTVVLEVIDMAGRRVQTLETQLENGKFSARIPVLELPAGVYSCTATVGKNTLHKKIIVKR